MTMKRLRTPVIIRITFVSGGAAITRALRVARLSDMFIFTASIQSSNRMEDMLPRQGVSPILRPLSLCKFSDVVHFLLNFMSSSKGVKSVAFVYIKRKRDWRAVNLTLDKRTLSLISASPWCASGRQSRVLAREQRSASPSSSTGTHNGMRKNTEAKAATTPGMAPLRRSTKANKRQCGFAWSIDQAKPLLYLILSCRVRAIRSVKLSKSPSWTRPMLKRYLKLQQETVSK